MAREAIRPLHFHSHVLCPFSIENGLPGPQKDDGSPIIDDEVKAHQWYIGTSDEDVEERK